MSGNKFYSALFHIMWEMEIDIFSEPEKTCALVSDLAPKCRKERKRLVDMYKSDAMDFIEMAVSKPDRSKLYLKKAVRSLVDYSDIDIEEAIEAINCVAGLWDTFPKLANDRDLLKNISSDRISVDLNENDTDSDENENEVDEAGGDEEVLFVEATEEDEENEEANVEEEEFGGEPEISVIRKIALYWCKGDDEDGRPRMFACPVGWVLIILSAVLGAFMIADITIGDKLAVPVFAFMFILLMAKRLYSYDSSARFGILICAFYLIAMLRNIFDNGSSMNYLCVPLVVVAVIVFNNGRISSWLDESKMKPVPAYLLIGFLSAAVAVGAYAVQNFVTI